MSAGLVAGIVSAALLYPLENLETRQQLATTTKEKLRVKVEGLTSAVRARGRCNSIVANH